MSETSSPRLDVEPSLSGEPFGNLRRQIEERLSNDTKSVYLGTLLGTYRRFVAENRSPLSHSLFVLVDLHSILVFEPEAPRENAPESERVEIASVLNWLIDGYSTQPIESVWAATSKQFPAIYSEIIADVIPVLFALRAPGSVARCDLITSEVEVHRPLPHPRLAPQVIERLEDGATLKPGSPESPFAIASTKVAENLRSGPPPLLDAWVSPAVGPIRECRPIYDFACLPYVSSKVSWNRGRKIESCYGKSELPLFARAAAQCEALERLQVAFHRPKDPLVFAHFESLGDQAVDPRDLHFGRGPGDPFGTALATYDHRVPLHWTWALQIGSEKARLVPAQEIWFEVDRLSDEPTYLHGTTNGCAVGSSLDEAALFALFEAIERDCLLVTWTLRRPCHRIDPASIHRESFEILWRRWQLEFPAYRCDFFDITIDGSAPTVFALARRRRKGRGAYSYCAAASRLSYAAACATALQDLTGFSADLAAAKREDYRRLWLNPESISSPADHFGFFAADESSEALTFLDSLDVPPVSIEDLDEDGPHEGTRFDLQRILLELDARLRSSGTAPYFKNLSHPTFARQGLYAVRAIVPGFLPLWFGPRSRRLHLTDRLKRLGCELCGREVRLHSDLNLTPHPFS